ncbi:MAG: maleylacetoacetate isomerase [Alphaproteobacteria bacterium]|nr:maleylacetoacetate isomerase [Alphaproteobacteria bacterium]
MIQLYNYYRSSASYRVRIALHLKQIPFTYHAVNLREAKHKSEAFKAINSFQAVPYLIDGEVKISQSLAILDYLESLQPEPTLYPKDPALRAKALEIALSLICDLHPLNNLKVLNYLRENAKFNDEQIMAWMHHWFHKILAPLEEMISKNKQTRYALTNSVSIVELCLIPQLYNARRFEIDLSKYSTLKTVESICLELDAFQKALPESQPDYV